LFSVFRESFEAELNDETEIANIGDVPDNQDIR
jgi:hypothetical protein